MELVAVPCIVEVSLRSDFGDLFLLGIQSSAHFYIHVRLVDHIVYEIKLE